MVSDFMKGRHNLMIYVGIDIAKLNYFAPAISSDGVILMEPFKFTNDGDGFSLLESNLTSICDDRTTSSSVLNQRCTAMPLGTAPVNSSESSGR